MSESTPLLLPRPQPVLSLPPVLRGPGGRRQSSWRSRLRGPWSARRRRRRARRRLAARTAPPGRPSGGRTRRLGPSTLSPPPSGAAEEKTQPRWEVGDTPRWENCPVYGLQLKLAANTGLKSVLKSADLAKGCLYSMTQYCTKQDKRMTLNWSWQKQAIKMCWKGIGTFYFRCLIKSDLEEENYKCYNSV